MFDISKQMFLQQVLVLLAQLCLSRAYGKIVLNNFFKLLIPENSDSNGWVHVKYFRKTSITHLQTVKRN